jgi:hypothetical protein
MPAMSRGQLLRELGPHTNPREITANDKKMAFLAASILHLASNRRIRPTDGKYQKGIGFSSRSSILIFICSTKVGATKPSKRRQQQGLVE